MKYFSQIKNALEILKKRGLINGSATLINAGILAFTRKINFYPSGYAYPFIRNIQIEPTKYCNMACPMCPNSYMKENEKGNMSYVDFIKIIKQFPFITTVRLQGLGESFLNPDIYKMIKYFKNIFIMIF